tara:strand:- start:228 stop:428 length:201 start_codon:yes stop_codon:yes gene_type:complete
MGRATNRGGIESGKGRKGARKRCLGSLALPLLTTQIFWATRLIFEKVELRLVVQREFPRFAHHLHG